VELNAEEYPLFTHREVDQMQQRWSYVRLKREISLDKNDAVRATFYDAGHILGSTGVKITAEGKSVFYTGDVCFEAQTISLPADFPKDGIDVLVMETTRGDFARDPEYTRRLEKERLAEFIRQVHGDGGAVLIPVFALGKSQELLMMLHEMVEHDLLPPVACYLGGLAAKITKLTDSYASRTTRAYPGFELMKDNHLVINEMGRMGKMSDEINPGTIYALSSGMMSEHTGSYNMAPAFMANPRNGIAFVGFTAPDSPSYALRNSKTGDMVEFHENKPPIKLNARVKAFDFSAHATREQLMNYATTVKPKKILLVHGDEPAQLWFKARLNEALPETEVLRPQPNEWIDL
jgi:Cft2 family RNA processing exonuclease